jgi:hypothetical protein
MEIQAITRKGGFVEVEHRSVAQERDARSRHEDTSAYLHRQRSKYLNRLLDDCSRNDQLQKLPHCLWPGGVACVATCLRAVRKLSTNK